MTVVYKTPSNGDTTPTDPNTLASQKITLDTELTPSLSALTISPSYCKLLVSWNIPTIASDAEKTVTLTEIYGNE
jgi:hypothetical protein